LTLQSAPSIRPALAAGAIPPPLFFERRRRVSIVCSSENGVLPEHSEKYVSVDHAVERPTHLSWTIRAGHLSELSPPKDI
jgi:hypothetical protein